MITHQSSISSGQVICELSGKALLLKQETVLLSGVCAHPMGIYSSPPTNRALIIIMIYRWHTFRLKTQTEPDFISYTFRITVNTLSSHNFRFLKNMCIMINTSLYSCWVLYRRVLICHTCMSRKIIIRLSEKKFRLPEILHLAANHWKNLTIYFHQVNLQNTYCMIRETIWRR